jgi:tRNA A37 N6-isopentenylltransferase MiaA
MSRNAMKNAGAMVEDDEWLLSLVLEYKYVTLYLQNKITYNNMIKEIENKSWQYAKRQTVWNKRYKNAIIYK